MPKHSRLLFGVLFLVGLAGSPEASAQNVPGAPTGVGTAAAHTQLTVRWTAPADNGGSAITGYKVQWKSGAQEYDSSRQATPGATATSHAITGLTNGTEYTVRVAATNDQGDSGWSEATGTPTAPGAPTNLAVTAYSTTAISLSWTAPEGWTLRPGTDGYNVNRCDASANATCTPAYLAWVTSGTAYTDSAVTSGTSYRYNVQACSPCGSLSSVATATASAPTAPDAPTGITTAGADQQLTVSWTAPADNGGTAITGYKLQWKSGAQDYDSSRQATPGATATSHAITGLTNATQYTVRVAATNAQGDSSWSSETIGRAGAPTVPGAPTGVSTAAANTQLTVRWTAPANNGGSAITGYKVQWKSGAQDYGSSRQATPGATATSHAITGLTNGTEYTVRVAATNDQGDSGWSSEATGSPTAPGAPTNLAVTAHSTTAISLSWTAPAGWTLRPGTDGYNVNRCDASANATCTPAYLAWVTSGTAYTDSAVTSGTSYRYSVQACSPCGNLSNQVTATASAYKLLTHDVTKTAVNIELYGHDGQSDPDWSYAITASGASQSLGCIRVSRGNGGAFNGLTAGTDYTAEAFWGLACDSTKSIATADFTTLANDAGPLPDLSVSNIGNNGATLSLANHTDAWWYQGYSRESGLGACTKVNAGTTTVTLTGLDTNTTYHYAAYGGPGCYEPTDSQPWSSFETFTTTGPITVTVSDKTQSGFKVTLAGFTGRTWSLRAWRKATDGSFPGTACKTFSTATQTTADVTGLESGKEYTVSVYKGASCNHSVDAISSTTTTVSMSANTVGPTSASLLLEHHEGAWHHKRAERGGAQATSTGGAQTAAVASIGAGGAGAQAASPAGGCAGPIVGGTADIDGLAPGTEYTWKAYKAAGCADADAIATATFATLEPSPAPVAEDLAPDFGGIGVADESYLQGEPIDALTLPEAEGGDGALAYALSPALPAGLSFDPATRTLSGTPAEALESTLYTYTATDSDAADADSASLTFALTVAAEPEPATEPTPVADLSPSFASGAAIADLVLAQNRPADAVTLPEATGGDGDLAYALSPALPAGLAFDMATRTLSGTPTEALEATAYAWTATDADEADPDSVTLSFTITVAADLAPSFAASAAIADLGLTQNRPADGVTLPEATGGDGDLTYALSPALPAGLSFDAAARALSGTPTEAMEATAYAWTATDADANDPDSATLSFTITVAADLAPSFAAGVTIADLGFTQNHPSDALTLPEADGGDGDLTYTLSPALPAGLSFDAVNRTLSGTPSEAAESATYTYTVTDSDEFGPDSASLTFALSVAADLSPSFAAGVTIADLGFTQNSPADPVGLPEASGGDGALTYTLSPALPAGLSFDAVARTLGGTPAEAAESALYTYTVTDSDEFGPDSASLTFSLSVAADLAPSFAAGAAIADLALQQTIPIDSRTLPEADGGDGDLTYTLSPALPAGLSFDAATRTLSGTPSEAAGSATYTYTVTDSDAHSPDSASLTFAVARGGGHCAKLQRRADRRPASGAKPGDGGNGLARGHGRQRRAGVLRCRRSCPRACRSTRRRGC